MKSENAAHPKTTSRWCTEVEFLKQIRTFEPTPSGFDPLKATERELLHYGFPNRPDLHRELIKNALWRSALMRSPKMLKAELAVDKHLGLRKRYKPQTGQKVEAPQSNAWAGAIVYGPATFEKNRAFNMVSARWQVPGVHSAPGDSAEPRGAACWVGLGGTDPFQPSLLQAGTSSNLDETGADSYSAWFEWYPNKNCPFSNMQSFPSCPVAIRNLTVSPNDTVNVLVCCPLNNNFTYGQVTILNETTNEGTTVGINAPAGVTSSYWFGSAECIVEADMFPEIAHVELADFGLMVFRDFICGASDWTTDTYGGTVVNITDFATPPKDLTVTAFVGGTCVVQWLATS
jgi:hypothetical protein